MKIKILTFSLFAGFITLLSSCIRQCPDAQATYMDEMTVEPKDFAADFKEVNNIVKQEYSLWKDKKIDLDGLYNSMAQRISKGQIRTKKDYGFLLLEYFGNLRAGHTFVLFKQYTAGRNIAYVEGSVFVDSPNSYLVKYGIRDRDQILAVNGQDIRSWIQDNKKYVAASTLFARQLQTAREVFCSYTDTIIDYTLLRGSDTLNIKLPLQREENFHDSALKDVVDSVAMDSVGYIALNTMSGDNLIEHFKTALTKISKWKRLVIDIRHNEGGSSDNAEKIAQFLIKAPQQACMSGRTLTPDPKAYTGRVALLVGTNTFAAAESFTLDLKESNNVLVIGEPTAGDTGNGLKRFRTKYGTAFSVTTGKPKKSPKGWPMEGFAIAPNIESRNEMMFFLKHIDPQLETALMYLTPREIDE